MTRTAAAPVPAEPGDPRTASVPAGCAVTGTGTAVSAADVAPRLRLVLARLHRRLRTASAGALTPTQLSTLATLSVVGPVRIGELATHEGVGAPTMTRSLASLETLGLVSRRTAAGDRRCSIVELSPAGRRRLHRIREESTALLLRQLAQLDEEELTRLAAGLDVLERLTPGVDRLR